MVTNEHNLAFGEFIEHLRRHGFTIGVDHYLRLQHLLDRVGGDCAPADLKTILCPIFATNNVQQEQFYHAFDSYFPLFQPSITQEQAGVESAQEQVGLIAEETKPVVPRKRFKVIATAVAATFVIALATATALYFFKKPQTETAIPPAEQIETEVPANVVAVETVVQPTPPGEELSFWERYGNGIRLAAVFLPLIIFAVYEWRRYRQRKLVLQQQRRKKPPYTWPLRVESSPARLYDSAEFYTAARLMRQRQVDEFYRLDVDATVAATIESLGYPTFRYKPYSKPPEYLALIDRASFRDHQARLFGELSAALEQEGVYVARYFYEGDPRVCSEPGGSYVQLAELQRRHAGHRLLIFGNGEKLIDPITGKLAAWTHLFMDWQGRALLTPEVPARWGHREINLAAEFVVLPATLAGLLAIVDHFEAPEAADLRSWLPDSDAPPPRDADFPALAASLRRYFGEEAFQWLCACAVYPELHWDLTLYLGQLECMGEGLIGEENLLRMIRLPWFRSGAMPDELRWLLIGQLNREKEKAIRRAIIELLEHSPPPQGSFADDAYQLNLALQRWLHSRDRERRREILRVVRTLPRSQAARDHTLVRFLESTRSSPLAILLPERLRKLFYQNGLSIFGLKTGVHLCAALLASAIALIVYLTNYSPAPSLPAGIDSPSVETVIVEPPPRMVFVKGGTFMMGTDDPDADPISKPAHLVTVSDFFLDINEVTNEEYYLFIKATGYKPPPHWKNGIYVPGEGRFPVVNVSWFDAKAYANWARKRLPTEAEWEYAARGPEGLKYPWGNEWKDGIANVGTNGTTAAGQFPKGASSVGAMDMIGNVWEWTADKFSLYPGNDSPQPLWILPYIQGESIWVIRGGAFDGGRTIDAAYRGYIDGSKGYSKTGFRCALDAAIVEPEATQPPVVAQAMNNNSSPVRVIRDINKNLPPASDANTDQPEVTATTTIVEGQEPVTPAIEGKVSDMEKKPLPNARVILKNNETGNVRTAVTAQDGSFSFSPLQPGSYTVTVSLNGYQDDIINVQLDPNTKIGLSPTLYSDQLPENPAAHISRPPRIIRKSSGVLFGGAIERVLPSYPPKAKEARITGAVVVEVLVNETGNVISAKAVSGHPLLRDIAVEAARQWKFQPTKMSGQPVRVTGTITFTFSGKK